MWGNDTSEEASRHQLRRAGALLPRKSAPPPSLTHLDSTPSPTNETPVRKDSTPLPNSVTSTAASLGESVYTTASSSGPEGAAPADTASPTTGSANIFGDEHSLFYESPKNFLSRVNPLAPGAAPGKEKDAGSDGDEQLELTASTNDGMAAVFQSLNFENAAGGRDAAGARHRITSFNRVDESSDEQDWESLSPQHNESPSPTLGDPSSGAAASARGDAVVPPLAAEVEGRAHEEAASFEEADVQRLLWDCQRLIGDDDELGSAAESPDGLGSAAESPDGLGSAGERTSAAPDPDTTAARPPVACPLLMPEIAKKVQTELHLANLDKRPGARRAAGVVSLCACAMLLGTVVLPHLLNRGWTGDGMVAWTGAGSPQKTAWDNAGPLYAVEDRKTDSLLGAISNAAAGLWAPADEPRTSSSFGAPAPPSAAHHHHHPSTRNHAANRHDWSLSSLEHMINPVAPPRFPLSERTIRQRLEDRRRRDLENEQFWSSWKDVQAKARRKATATLASADTTQVRNTWAEEMNSDLKKDTLNTNLKSFLEFLFGDHHGASSSNIVPPRFRGARLIKAGSASEV